jgi:hypothetical protein
MCQIYFVCHIQNNIRSHLKLNEIALQILVYISGFNARSIAQEVTGWLPTKAARVRAQVRSYGICGGESGTGASFI